ncbi:MAG: DHH family phosphoesterase [Adlercreutzia sp.]
MTVTPQTNTTLSEIASALAERDRFVIGGHVSPDGDCLGSALGLAWALRQLGKQVTCVLARDEEPPSDLMFLPGADGLVPAARFEGPCECFIAVDVHADGSAMGRAFTRRRPSRSPWIIMQCPGP